MKRVIFAVLMILFALPYSCGAKGVAVESREYKILLKAENFTSIEAGCKQFWRILEKVAGELKIEVKGKKKFLPEREISFLDTAKFDFYKKGFILRLRGADLGPVGRAVDGDRSELTLKFRAPDLESVSVAPVKPNSDYESEISCEEDVVVKFGKPSVMYSCSGKINGYTGVPDITADVNKYFSDFPVVGIAGKAKIMKVNNIVIQEKRVQSGSLFFGEKKTKTLFSIWYKKGQTKPFAAEFSFKIKLEGKNAAKTVRNIDQVENFFVELAKNSVALSESKQTKTGMVYQLK